MNNEFELLVEKEKIKDLLVSYAVALDYKNWPVLEQVFHDDIHVEYGEREFIDGKHEDIGMIRRYLDGCGPTQHLLGNFRIEISGTTATSACYVRGIHAGAGDKSEKSYDLWAEYQDQWELTDGGWRIKQRIEHIFNEVGDLDVFGPGEE